MKITVGVRLAVVLILSSGTVMSSPSVAASAGPDNKSIGERMSLQKPRGVRHSTVVGSGEVLPNRYVKITSEGPGRIQKIFVEPGDEITKGEPLLLIGLTSPDKDLTKYSPLQGIVADVSTRVGESLTGGRSDEPLMTLADMSKIFVEVNLDGHDISKVVVGRKAKIIVDAFSETQIRGLVIRKDPHPVAPTDTPEFRVTIQITQVSTAIRRRLRPGMSATAWISF